MVNFLIHPYLLLLILNPPILIKKKPFHIYLLDGLCLNHISEVSFVT